MFERVDQMAPSIPSDSDWIVYTDAEEFWDAALFSFPSNYDGNRARSYIQAESGAFNSGKSDSFSIYSKRRLRKRDSDSISRSCQRSPLRRARWTRRSRNKLLSEFRQLCDDFQHYSRHRQNLVRLRVFRCLAGQ